ncbi:flagellin N-methylase [Paraburkholderia sp. Ac-20340]|uniref:flagellin N-methylase n=1 Tax=Paraburkholderia sp. Ac-20340 TaxID=2703888 RepID=UPI0019825287|nr:flagellin N-methylase [Paraburkholderia sp. Ac-20340]MBN3855830.1 flagellin N-methylase [Paraburkholderia sp. Ac-20340]
MVARAWSLACNACGKCCDSPPALTLREWFARRSVFIGSLAIERVARRRVGERLVAQGVARVLDAQDVAEHDALADALFHRLGARDAGWISITLQGYDYPSAARCPALAHDGRCTLHETGKPGRCEAVPLDPLVPDRWQAVTLGARRESVRALGADCIREGLQVEATPLIDGARVIDTRAIERERAALIFERKLWRDAVAAALLASPGALLALAPGARLTIAPVPALLAVARVSGACRQACVDVIGEQRRLIESSVAAALARRRSDERAFTQELRGFALAHARAFDELARLPAAAMSQDQDFAREVEGWLGG